MKLLPICAAIIFMAMSLNAEVLKIQTELSYIQTGGNTDTKSFGLDFHGEKGIDQLGKLTLDLEINYAQTNGIETKNAWLVEPNYFYKFSERLSFNYLVGYKDDKFSGFDNQFYTGPGLEYLAFKDDKMMLTTNVNALFERDRYKSGDSDSYIAGRVGLLFAYKIYDNFKFVEDANIRTKSSDMNNYFVYAKSSIYSKINENFSLGVSYKIDYQNEPPAGKKKTDTTFMVSLVIGL